MRRILYLESDAEQHYLVPHDFFCVAYPTFLDKFLKILAYFSP